MDAYAAVAGSPDPYPLSSTGLPTRATLAIKTTYGSETHTTKKT